MSIVYFWVFFYILRRLEKSIFPGWTTFRNALFSHQKSEDIIIFFPLLCHKSNKREGEKEGERIRTDEA